MLCRPCQDNLWPIKAEESSYHHYTWHQPASLVSSCHTGMALIFFFFHLTSMSITQAELSEQKGRAGIEEEEDFQQINLSRCLHQPLRHFIYDSMCSTAWPWDPSLYSRVSSPGHTRISCSIKQPHKGLQVQHRALTLQICEWCRGICKHLLHIIVLQTLLILALSLIGGKDNCSSLRRDSQELFLLLCRALFARFGVP